jgi:ADP-heptose:LPS heptosyltransferase
MGSCYDAAISGFNEYLQTTKRQNKPGVCNFSLTLFDDRIERPVQNADVHNVAELTNQTYRLGGMTALYDAVVTTIEGLRDQVKARKDTPAVLVAIMTDGGENSSREYNQTHLRNLINKLQKEGNWTFVFMGANQDSYANAAQMGITKGNVMNWTADKEGTKSVFAAMAFRSAQYADLMTANASRGVAMNSASFFEDSQ